MRLVRFGKMADRWYMFRWIIYDKTVCHIIRCIESGDFQGFDGIHESWENNINEEEQWAKINPDKKRYTYIVIR